MYRLRTLFFSILTLVAFSLTACDSGTAPGQESGPGAPTLSISSSTVAAPEIDTTISFDVELRNPIGAEVTAELIYAAGASSAGPEDLGFSTDGLPQIGDAFVVETLTFPAGTTDDVTRTFTYNILDTLDAEARESAFFALQNVSSPEQIAVGNNQIEVSIGFRPIREIRQFDDGRTVAANGIVTRYDDRNVYFQDETAGIVAFEFAGEIADGTSIGDEIVVNGELGEFNGLRQVGPTVNSFSVISTGNDLPDPLNVTIDDITSAGESYEGRLVRVENITTNAQGTFSSGTTYEATDASGSMAFRVQGSSPVGGADVPSGEFTFEGVVGEFQGEYQLLPLRETDIITQ
ncbi:hypothetical protein CRI94_05495 [Longibacter salinarum]|uniref:DUF5689 domain-containing protein n=1 Tax=Longibacter salinarum TaxID=1850348 RepID=A0A2A8D0S5_9BACT|nr:DUF5689 domain-containing protein [Longibacter salinarum]PEN14480.1 hypothetical protein CRI94_05495 [Longibacter salinarum]